MINFLLFPPSLHKRLGNLLNCICMPDEINQLSGLHGVAAVHGHLLIWPQVMCWGQQMALVATRLHPGLHPPPACSLQAVAIPLFQGEQKVSHLSWTQCRWGSFPWNTYQDRWCWKGQEWPDWGLCSCNGEMEGRSWLWMGLMVDPSVMYRFLGAWKLFSLQRASCHFQGGWSVDRCQTPV